MELDHPCHGLHRMTVALFANDDGSPFTKNQSVHSTTPDARRASCPQSRIFLAQLPSYFGLPLGRSQMPSSDNQEDVPLDLG